MLGELLLNVLCLYLVGESAGMQGRKKDVGYALPRRKAEVSA
jgi:hypothetical protein